MSHKVLHIITRFLKGGGTEKNTVYSIQALDKTKFSIDIAMGRESDLSYAKNVLPEVNEIIMIEELDNDFHPVKNLRALHKIFRLVRQNHYTIVHTHQCKAGILGIFAAKLVGTPIIIFGLHGDYLENPRFVGLWRRIYKTIEQIAVRYATILISVGEELKERYLERYRLLPSRCEVVRSGMDLTNFYRVATFPREKIEQKRKELNIEPEEPVIGKVSSLEFRKGYKFAIQAAEKIIKTNSKNIRFLFVGDGRERSHLEKMSKRLGLGERIIFTGFRNDVDELMGVFDIFIFTSLMEGVPQVLVQAAAAGKPIVSFEVEGAKEIIIEGVNGFIVPSRDIDALTEKINYLISNPQKSREMGEKGREVIGNRWDISDMQRRIRYIYDELTSEIT